MIAQCRASVCECVMEFSACLDVFWSVAEQNGKLSSSFVNWSGMVFWMDFGVNSSAGKFR